MSEISVFHGFDFTGTDWADRNVDIAARLGCDPVLVAQARQHFGMVIERYPDIPAEELEGPVKELAERHGVSERAIIKKRAQKGVSRERVDWAPADWRKKNIELAREFGVLPASVAYARKKYAPPHLQQTPGKLGGRPPIQGKKMHQKASFFFGDDEYAALQKAAEARGITIAALVRAVMREHLTQAGFLSSVHTPVDENPQVS